MRRSWTRLCTTALLLLEIGCSDGLLSGQATHTRDAGSVGHDDAADTFTDSGVSPDGPHHVDGAGVDGPKTGDDASADQGQPTATCTKTIGPSDNINDTVGQAGSVLCLQSGVYHQVIRVDNSGNAGNPIIIQAAPGASPIIDGQDTLPGSDWSPLVGLNGDHIVVDGLEIRNSDGCGVILLGAHNRLSNCNVHHIYQAGVLAQGDDSVIEHNEVWETALVNSNGGSGGWPTAIAAARDQRGGDGITNRAIIRGNISHDNWGEGIDSFEAEGTLIEGNICYNNWSVSLYVSDSRNVIVRNNLVYVASPTGGRGGGIDIADERADKPRSSNVEVTNNIVYGEDLCVVCWTEVSGLSNINAHHNTVVSGSVNLDASNGSGIAASANCELQASQVPGLGAVTPGSLTPQMFAGASCPAGSGADVSAF